MEKWMVYTKKADFNKLAEEHMISPIIARIMTNRDIRPEMFPKYLKGDIKDLYSPNLLKDMDKAVNIIINKINKNKKIRIIGDYDIDGVCATYILTKGLEKAGALVDMDIPDRVKDGYGININIIDKALKDNIDTIITCDNGISAYNEIEYAKENGMTVIITDHHNIPEKMGQGHCVIDPKQKECNYPFKEICGASVAYKLICSIYESLNMDQIYSMEFIQFAGIATIGDVVELKDENRILAKKGIEYLKNTKNQGLKALIDVNNIEIEKLTSYHIGFVIGPCLNAGGRLETAKKAYDLFCIKDYDEALKYAEELKSLNEKRKEMTEDGTKKAVDIANDMKEDKILVIYLPEVHESIAGIIAGRIREHFYRPVIILTESEEKDHIKGSARSVEGFDMFLGLNKVKDLLSKFGGHEMAAGMSLLKSDLENFRELINSRNELNEDILTPKYWIDVPVPFEYNSESLVEEMKILEPFGKGNEKPYFAEKNIKIKSLKILGKNQNVIKMILENNNKFRTTGMIFGRIDIFIEEIEKKYGKAELEKVKAGLDNEINMSIIYYPQINEYNGNKSLQVIIYKHQLN